MNKGHAIRGAVDAIIFDHPAAMVEPIGGLRPGRTFLTVSGTRDREASELAQILNSRIAKPNIDKAWMPHHRRKLHSPALMRAALFLAA